MIIINSIGTIGAGPKAITKSLIKDLVDNKIDKIHGDDFIFYYPSEISLNNIHCSTNYRSIPIKNSWYKYFVRVLSEFYIAIRVFLLRPSDTYLVLANYSPFPSFCKKIILVRHPYLLESTPLGVNNTTCRKFLEFARKLVFLLSVKTSNVIIVQSDYMRDLFMRSFSNYKGTIKVIPNPLRLQTPPVKNINKSNKTSFNDVIYIARYYSHKNHIFLVDLCDKYSDILRAERIRFYITLDNRIPDANKILDQISLKGIDDIIINLGEIDSKELSILYEKAMALFFPSQFETFGNPIIEAMAFGVPVVLPDLPYGRVAAGDAGLFFKPWVYEDAISKLFVAIKDNKAREELIDKGYLHLKNIPSPTEWINLLVSK